MAPQLLFDLSAHDLDKVLHDAEYIESYNPHRGCMRLLDAIVWEDFSDKNPLAIGYKDVRDDEFWVDGHIPGRPIFPGVLMIEAAAQFASYLTMRSFEKVSFIGFAGVDGVKFRGQVAPGDRLYILIEGFNMKPRRSICRAQGVVDGNLVFEAVITGMPI
ncbi:MAG: 3-hydroxyacyl-ACP dehydratase FabZ family protein [Phycisphaeraceae bacterium]